MDIGSGLGVAGNQQQHAFAARRIDYYVDSVLGSDLNDGSAHSPLRTFQYAVNMADESNNPGHNNIYLKPGNYDGVQIYDEDPLKVFGLGHHSSDVRISGDSGEGDTIHIHGGEDVRLFNMLVTGSSENGIYAQDLDYLFVKNVISNHHDGDGLNVNYVEKTKVYNSSLVYNGGYGAHVEEGYHFRSSHSYFDSNYDGGIGLDYIDKVQMVSSTARENDDGFGLDGYTIGELAVIGGQYNGNYEKGIGLQYVDNMKFLGVEAVGNGNDGIHADYFDSAVIQGGFFADNDDDGVELIGGTAQLADRSNSSQHEFQLQVFGGLYHDNGEDGLDIEDVGRAQLIGVDARRNYDNGVRVQDVDFFHMIGGYLYQNEVHGASLFGVHHAQINDLVAKDNYETGLRTRGGYRLNVIGGVFSYNGNSGIDAEGGGPPALQDPGGRLQRVDIKHATALGNETGVGVENAYLVKMVGGNYSENSAEGIVISNVTRGMFEHLLVKHNGQQGLRFEAGLDDDGGVAQADGHAGANWNMLEFTGGLYKENGWDGIYVVSYVNDARQPAPPNSLHIYANHVVARNNGYSGFNVTGEITNGGSDIEDGHTGNYGAGTNLYLSMHGGYYGHNGYDGIYLLGADPQQDDSIGTLQASLTDVVAEFNDGYGVNASGLVPFENGNDPESATHGGGHNGGPSLQFVRGFYGFNGGDGINLNLTIVPLINGDNGALTNDNGIDEPSSLAMFDHVVANHNDGRGVALNVFIADINGDPGDPGDVLTALPNNNHVSEPAPVEFRGGVFNHNGRAGIVMTLDADFEEETTDPPHLQDVAIRLTDVVASSNGANGLAIRNFEPAVLEPNVEIIQGSYNHNGNDGIQLRSLGTVLLYRAHVIGNHDNGVDYSFPTELLNEYSIVVANRNGDFRYSGP